MKAEGYLMDATLEDGILTVEGRGRAGRFALDWDMRERMERMIEADEGSGRAWDAQTRANIKTALTDKTTPRVPVGIIDRAEFKDASPLVNGSITIHVEDKKAIFHFRRKTRDQARALYEELLRQMNVSS